MKGLQQIKNRCSPFVYNSIEEIQLITAGLLNLTLRIPIITSITGEMSRAE